MRARYLTPSDVSTGRAVSRRSLAEQAAFMREFDPVAFRALQGWSWSRKTARLTIDTPDVPPKTAHVFATLEAIEYIAIKRDPSKGSQRAVYRHRHEAPYATIVTTAKGARAMNDAAKYASSNAEESAPPPATLAITRNAPKLAGPALFLLGELFALEGVTPEGERLNWRAPKGLALVGDPHTDTMHVFRRGAARRTVGPIWIIRGRSPYRITDRGIDR